MSPQESSDDDDDVSTNVKQIPGYYYDKKKKKYFKIQQNGFNVQEGSVTVSTVKKRKERQRVKKQEKQLEIRKVADNILTRHYQSQLYGVAATSKLHAMKLNGKQAQQVFETDIDGAKEFPNALTMLTTFGMLAQLRNNMRRTRLDVYKVDLTVKSEGQLKRKPVPYCWNYTDRRGDEWSHCRLIYYAMAELADKTMAVASNDCMRCRRCHNYTPTISLCSYADPVFGSVGDLYLKEDTCLRCLLRKRHVGVPVDVVSCPGEQRCLITAQQFVDYRSIIHRIEFGNWTDGEPRVAQYYKLDAITEPVLAIDRQKPVLYVGSKEGHIIGLDFRSSKPVRLFNHHVHRLPDRKITSMLALDDDYTIATNHISGLKGLLDIRMNSFKAYNKDTMGQAYCDGGKLKTDESYSYITSSGDGRSGVVRIYDTRNLETIKIIRLPQKALDTSTYTWDITTRYGEICVLATDNQSTMLYSS